MPFDARAARALQPGAHLTYSEAPGLRLVASATRRTWVYRYKSGTLMKQVKLGEWPAMTWGDALAAWGEQRATKAAGADPGAAKRADRAKVAEAAQAAKRAREAEAFTVRKLCDSYLVSLKLSRKAKGRTEVGRLFDTMLAPIAELAPAAVTRSVAFDLIMAYSATPVVAKALRAELGGAWDHGYDSGRLSDDVPNWWRQILRGKLRTKGRLVAGEVVNQKRVLDEKEIGALINWLPNYPRNTQDALVLYLWTMCRGAEIVSMHADEIRQEGAVLWWQLPKAKTKNANVAVATDLRVPLVGRAKDVVKRRLAASPGGYLFANGRKGTRLPHIDQRAVGVAVWYQMPYSQTRPEAPRARCPITLWAPHDLRRSSRTLVASMGCQNDVGEALLGHVQPGIVGVYNLYSYDAERLAWLEKLSDKLEALAAAAVTV
jgi:integrase